MDNSLQVDCSRRQAALFAMLLAEIVGFSLRFDVPAMGEPGRLGAWLFSHTDLILLIGIPFAGTLALLIGDRWASILQHLGAPDRPRWRAWMISHLAVLVAFFAASVRVFDSSEISASEQGAWYFALWLVLGALVVATWSMLFAPARAWLRLGRAEWKILLVSAAAGALAWSGGLAARSIWYPLAQGTLQASAALLHLLYGEIEVDAENHLIGMGSFRVGIAPSCSGYEGIALITVFVAAYLWMFRKSVSFPRALLLFPLGIAVMMATNVMRITALVIVGSVSPDIAVLGFHSNAGWIGFTVVSVALIWFSHRSGLVGGSRAGTDASDDEMLRAAVPLLVPMLVLLFTGMLVAAFSSGFDALYPLSVIATAVAMWQYRHAYRSMPWGTSWHSVAGGALVFAIWLLLEPGNGDRGSELTTSLADLPPWQAALWLVFRVLGSVVVVPVAEELAFRGYLIRRLSGDSYDPTLRVRFTWWSFAVSSALFGLMHERWLAGTLAGAVFALVLYRRGRLADAVMSHVTANFLIAVSVLGFQRWELWA